MLLSIDKDLKRLDVYANGIELATVMGKSRKDGKRFSDYGLDDKIFVGSFDNPVLIYDDYRISMMPPTQRITMHSLFSHPRTTIYDGVPVYWNPEIHKNVWSFSIDTGLFLRAFNKIVDGLTDTKTAADIGTGSGHIAKYVLEKMPHLEKMLAIDMNPYAIQCAKESISDPRAAFTVGDGLKAIAGKKFDLLLCNPPYIPRPGSIDDNPYEGVSLLYHMLHHGHNYLNDGGSMLINVSSLAMPIIFQNKPRMRMEHLDFMKVPLKVNNILNDKEWLSYLIGKGLQKEQSPDYEYWQDLHLLLLRN